MEKVVESVEKAKSVDDVCKAVEKLIVSCQAALADGFQPASDIPAVVAASAMDVIAAVGSAGKIKADWAEDKLPCEKALALHAVSLKELLLK